MEGEEMKGESKDEKESKKSKSYRKRRMIQTRGQRTGRVCSHGLA
jgi:hypothetical protein